MAAFSPEMRRLVRSCRSPPSGAWIASAAASIMFFVSKDGQQGLRSSNDFCSFGCQAVVQLMAMERARSDHKEISIYALSEMSHR